MKNVFAVTVEKVVTYKAVIYVRADDTDCAKDAADSWVKHKWDSHLRDKARSTTNKVEYSAHECSPAELPAGANVDVEA